MNFNCLIKRDTMENWINYNPVLRDKELAAIYIDNTLYGYKIGDGRSAWCELNYTNLADLGEFRIYVDKNDTIVTMNLNPGIYEFDMRPGVYECKDELIRGTRARAIRFGGEVVE